MATSLKHVWEFIELYFDRKKLTLYSRRDFRSTDATAYDTAFFNIIFHHLLFAKNSKM